MCTVVFFFFKQKTAYEMRISDWSSDVCSSDLHREAENRVDHRNRRQIVGGRIDDILDHARGLHRTVEADAAANRAFAKPRPAREEEEAGGHREEQLGRRRGGRWDKVIDDRSAEQTSELQ